MPAFTGRKYMEHPINSHVAKAYELSSLQVSVPRHFNFLLSPSAVIRVER